MENGRCVCTYMLVWRREDRLHIHLLLYRPRSVEKKEYETNQNPIMLARRIVYCFYLAQKCLSAWLGMHLEYEYSDTTSL